MKLCKRSERCFLVLAICSLLSVIALNILYKQSLQEVEQVIEKKFRTEKIAEQLRHTSDDLTDLVRLYVVTGDARFKQGYLDVLDFRDGSKAWPSGYDSTYWDLHLANRPQYVGHHPSGPGKPLLELMEEAGFTSEEMQQMEQAKHASDQLAEVEQRVMAMVEASPESDLVRKQAIEQLHDAEYRHAKYQIMLPIHSFLELSGSRMELSLQRVQQRTRNLLTWVMLLGGATLLFLGLLFLELLRQSRAKAEQNAMLCETQRIGQVGSWELSLRSQELKWSNEVYRLFEFDPEQSPPSYEHFLEVIHPEDRSLLDKAYNRAVSAGETFDFSHRLLFTDGRIKWVRERGEVVYSRGGVPWIKGMVQNITQQVESEQQLQELMRAKDNFLATMSHELRTPLAAVMGNVALLLDEVEDPDQRALLENIERASEGELALVSDILDLSNIEAGKIQLHESPYSLTQLVVEVEGMISPQMNEKGLLFKVRQVDLPSMPLLGDEHRIKQILMNLLSNAVKFTSQGNVTLTVSTQAEQLTFSVEDEGVGIKLENMERLFKPFEQEDSSISRRYGGAGLGLYISHSLAVAMGGDIEVESALGEGSTFTLVLPYRPTEQVDPLRPSESQVSYPQEQRPLSGKVLLAEDAPELQLLIRRVVEKQGPEVVVVENGLLAVEVAAQQQLDLILMDMQMPVMDGLEACRLIRASGNPVPIVALTANVLQKHRQQFEDAGSNGFLSKPVDREALREVLAQYLLQTGS